MYDPDSYDVYSEFQRRDARELIPYLISSMSWDDAAQKTKNISVEDDKIKILDFGCGSGFITQKILLPLLNNSCNLVNEDELSVYGIDLSQKMIDFASEKYGGNNLTYMVADIMKEDCEFPCKFSKIFSFHVFHWIMDQGKAFKHLYDLLTFNGEIGTYFISSAAVFSVYDAMGQIKTWKKFLPDVKNFIPKTHYSIDAAGEMRELLIQIGYIVQEAVTITRKFTFISLDSLIDSAMAANPFIHRIPIELRGEYKKDFESCFEPYVKFSSNYNKGVEVDYELMVIRAYKPHF